MAVGGTVVTVLHLSNEPEKHDDTIVIIIIMIHYHYMLQHYTNIHS